MHGIWIEGLGSRDEKIGIGLVGFWFGVSSLGFIGSRV